MGLALTLCAAALGLLLHQAWQTHSDQLHYIQGQWFLQSSQALIAGNLRIHLDFQRYILLSFTAQPAPRWPLQAKQTWLHLDAWQQDAAGSSDCAWLTKRRAVYAPVACEASSTDPQNTQ